MMRITSTANDRIREIRKLRNRKDRDISKTFFLEGIRLVAEAIEQTAEIEELIYAPELLNSSFGISLVERYQENKGKVLEVSKDVFSAIAQKENPQGLAAVAKQRWASIDNLVLQKGDIWVVLDTVRDPGNLGTIQRTIDAVNGTGIILLDDSCDPYDPTSVRASMGAIFTRLLIKTKLVTFTEWKNQNNVKVIGTSDHEGHFHYREYQYPNPVLLLMGSERAGLTDAHIALCDDMVMIPMAGFCDSLNLSVATGIALYEIFDQFHGREGGK